MTNWIKGLRRVSVAPLMVGALLGGPSAASAQPELAVPYQAPQHYLEHGKLFEEKVHRIGDSPAWLLEVVGGFGINMALVEGDKGLVLIDTGVNIHMAEAALKTIREQISDKPIVAVIYTHHHVDHVNGTGVFVSREDAASGKVKIIAADNFIKEMADENVATVPAVAARAPYMYGFALSGQAAEEYHVGCCGPLGPKTDNRSAFLSPNTFVPVDGAQDIELAGVRMHVFHTGGEAASELGIYLPDHKVLFSADEIQGPTFPNLHSLRGTKMRDATRWVRALGRMQKFDAHYLVPGHGKPVEGREQVAKLLRVYQDAIQYTHDQAIRLINKGTSLRELPHALNELPPYLQMAPYTTEYYGTVADAVRSYYVGYISWFSGDAVELAPTEPVDHASRMVQLMGGRDRVLEEAGKAFERGDAQWTAELTTPLIRIDHEDMDARKLKAAAFRKLGYASANSTWRSFYLMGALELEGKLDKEGLSIRYNNPESMAQMPAAMALDSLRYRIDPAKAKDTALKLNLEFTDVGERYALELRNSTLKVSEGRAEQADGSIRLTRVTLAKLVLEQLTVEKALQQKAVSGEQPEALKRFIAALDLSREPFNLVVR